MLKRQNGDGGWGQTAEMESDAYATGQTLFVLNETKNQASDIAEAVDAGIAFLLKNREPDGSWHVVTRAKPIQKYFDNGDPHGKDQFISTPATAWAVAALAATLPDDRSVHPISFNRDVRPILSDRCLQCPRTRLKPAQSGLAAGRAGRGVEVA